MSSASKVKSKLYKRRSWFSSALGQRFFNFAYSIGAAIVIWGALFKILHLPGGNVLLSIGMGTEVLMFILTAFDRPAKEYDWERVYPVLDDNVAKELDRRAEEGEETPGEDSEDAPQGVSHGSGIVVVGGQGGVVQGGVAVQGAPAGEMTAGAGVSDVTVAYIDQLSAITDDLRRLHESTTALNSVSETLLESYRAITENSENITRSSTGYVQQMADLSKNISGLNTIYEIQLKSISSQLDSIDRVNRGIKDIRDMYEKSAEQSERYCRETEKMARYMQQLNTVYEKMITAMTINMYNPMMPGQSPVRPAPPNHARN
ncbi:MAG: gliding motility protein GldL, partial [Muribaculaceae bacterium]|nr:gliding motility protein GldL [Muribaculaceae bacterium]